MIEIELLKVQKKALPDRYYFCQILQKITKVILLGQGLFLDFQQFRCYKMTVIYLYFEVWVWTDQGFQVWGCN